jgi:soluble lytic murein transglycosylase-like protein
MFEILIIVTALNNNIDPTLLKAVCYKETRLRNVHNLKDGGSGSYGVCQVKLLTAKQIGFPLANLADPKDNIEVAGRYLAYNLERCTTQRSAIAAYNTGHCVKEPRRGGYVDSVLKIQKEFQ